METTPEERIGQLIRCNHPWAFRRGQWGQIVGIEMVQKPEPDCRWYDCYVVMWDVQDSLDRRDLWRVEDPDVTYEFAAVLT